jgi:hypothetical protein
MTSIFIMFCALLFSLVVFCPVSTAKQASSSGHTSVFRAPGLRKRKRHVGGWVVLAPSCLFINARLPSDRKLAWGLIGRPLHIWWGGHCQRRLWCCCYVESESLDEGLDADEQPAFQSKHYTLQADAEPAPLSHGKTSNKFCGYHALLSFHA